MAEQESVIGLISQDLVNTLNGICLPYNGVDNFAKADFQRSEDYFDVSPFIVVAFAGSQKISTSSQSILRKAKYDIFCYVNNINDNWDPDKDFEHQVSAITKTLKNIPAYIEKEILVDIKRDNKATLTEIEDIDQFFVPTLGNESVMFVSYLEVFVQYWVEQFNPFNRVG